MPLSAMVTPLSLYLLDNTIFDGMQLPTPPNNPTEYPDLYVQGFQLDREILVDNLLMETGELNVLYPDPEFFKYAVTQWSKKELPVWQALYNTLFYRYNPLWNKDGTIKETAKDLTQSQSSGSRVRSSGTEKSARDLIDEVDTHDLADTRTPNLTTTTGNERRNSGTTEDTEITSSSDGKTGTTSAEETGSQVNSNTTLDSGSKDAVSQHSGGTTTTGSSTSETQVSAYNETTYRNKDKTIGSTSETVVDTTKITDGESSSNVKSEDLNQETRGQSSGTEQSRTDSDGSRLSSRSDDHLETEDGSERTTGTDETTHTGTLSRSGDNTRSEHATEDENELTDGAEAGSLDHTMTRIETGNIGVTMTTQMIAAQREIVRLNFYSVIIDAFKERFCLLVY